MKYKVFVHELEWYNRVYEIEANSEEEAREEIEDGDGDIISEDYDCCEQRDIEFIKLYEN